MSTFIRIRGFSGPRFRAAFLLPVVLFAAGLAPAVAADSPPTVMLAAAASLERVFEREIIPAFKTENSGVTVEATYDSSGKLQTQIENGLAADVFMSAATTQMDALVGKGFIAPDSVVPLLENKIVLIRPASGASAAALAAATFTDTAKANVVAVGDPESVPAGQYAREIFTNLGVWDAVAAKASFGSNVTEVLNWVAEGSAELGVVYATDAASSDRVEVICEAPDGLLKSEVVYPAGMLSASAHPEEAERLLSFLTSDTALAAFRKYGFSVSKSVAVPAPPAGGR